MDEIIKIYETYGMMNLGLERNIHNLLKVIKLPNNSNITLDLKNCITDYPSTSKLIDALLSHLEKFEGEKKLTILFEGIYSRLIIFPILFSGSKFLNINDKFILTVDEWDFILNELKEKKRIKIEVVLF